MIYAVLFLSALCVYLLICLGRASLQRDMAISLANQFQLRCVSLSIELEELADQEWAEMEAERQSGTVMH